MKKHLVPNPPGNDPPGGSRKRAILDLGSLSVVVGTVVVCAAVMGCSADDSSRRSSSNATVPVTVVQQVEAPPTSPAVPEAPPAPVVAVVPQAGDIPAPPTPPKLTASAEEVVHLAQARVGDDVIAAYIEGVDTPFELDSETIVYLTDLGVPAETIASMVRRDQLLKGRMELAQMNTSAAEVAAPPDGASVPPPAEEPVSVEQPPADMMVSESAAPPPPSESVADGQPVTQVTNNYFYNTLSPYGTWVDVPDYGWCWQPSVVLAQADWRPYCHGGRWVWSDCGWYWQSYYSWGWAPFHYGRWHLSSHHGWVWAPGTVWGPAWVTWRYYDGYCGWAPLPPAACYTSGIGFTYYGSSVGFSFGFGLSSACYSFVPTSCFYTSRPWTYRVPHTTVNKFYGDTTVINNYVQGNNNTIINRGIGTDSIAAVSREEIRQVRVSDTVEQGLRGEVRAERLSRDGTTLAAYRPLLPEQAGRPPMTITRRQEQAAVRSATLVESTAVEAARMRASSGESRTRLNRNDTLTTSALARPASEPISAAQADANRPGTRYSTETRTLPFRAQREEVATGRVEPPRSTPSSATSRSMTTQSAVVGSTIPAAGRVEPRLSRTPNQPSRFPGATESNRSPSVGASSASTYNRATVPSRSEPRLTRPEIAIPPSRAESARSQNLTAPTTRDLLNSTRRPSTPDRSTRPTVQIPQRSSQFSQPARRSTYQPPAVQRPPSSTYSPRSTTPPRSYPSRSIGTSRPTYTPPAAVRSAPSPAPSSSFRNSPAPSRSAPAPRPAPSSPSRTGARSVQRR